MNYDKLTLEEFFNMSQEDRGKIPDDVLERIADEYYNHRKLNLCDDSLANIIE